MGGKIQMKLIWNSHKKQVTWEVWPFSTITPPKNYTYTPLLSHMDNVTLSNTFTPIYLFNIHTSYKSHSNDALLFNAWPCLSWFGLELLGLGLGLGPHLLQRLIRRTLNALALVHFGSHQVVYLFDNCFIPISLNKIIVSRKLAF